MNHYQKDHFSLPGIKRNVSKGGNGNHPTGVCQFEAAIEDWPIFGGGHELVNLYLCSKRPN